jgi:hypothetical protein
MHVWIYGCIDVWMDGSPDGWMGDGKMSGCMGVWMYGHMDGWRVTCTDRYIYGWIHVRTHGFMHGLKDIFHDVWMYGFMGMDVWMNGFMGIGLWTCGCIDGKTHACKDECMNVLMVYACIARGPAARQAHESPLFYSLSWTCGAASSRDPYRCLRWAVFTCMDIPSVFVFPFF